MDRALRLLRPKPPEAYIDFRRLHAEPADILLGSRTAAALLAFLTLHPGLQVDLAEAEWRTGSSHESMHRAVARLMAAGVLEPGWGSTRRTFVLPASPRADELRRLLLAYGSLGSRLRWVAASETRALTHALVYGSIAAGTETASSDVDVLTVGSATAGQVLRAFGELTDVLGREIHVVAYSSQQFTADLDAGLSFLRNVLSSPVIRIVGDEVAMPRLAA